MRRSAELPSHPNFRRTDGDSPLSHLVIQVDDMETTRRELAARGVEADEPTSPVNVQDELLSRGAGRHPQVAQLAKMFDDIGQGALPNLRAYMASEIHTHPDHLFNFAIDCIIAGLEAQLPPKKPRR